MAGPVVAASVDAIVLPEGRPRWRPRGKKVRDTLVAQDRLVSAARRSQVTGATTRCPGAQQPIRSELFMGLKLGLVISRRDKTTRSVRGIFRGSLWCLCSKSLKRAASIFYARTVTQLTVDG